MKPVTQERIDRIMDGHESLRRLLEIHRIPIRESIRIALLEQDRDTRHACAEAVNAIPFHSPGLMPDGTKATCFLSLREFKSAAHQACMNAHSI